MSPFDRASLDGAVADAVAGGIGVLAKRPLANAAWVFEEPPEAQDVRIYWVARVDDAWRTHGASWRGVI